ncbi:MAG: hypothetical protein HY660_02420, partial [Armatimonadetes bacterium]|nr:hypothetical protein [Armatimonadota bacterium]
RLDRLFDDDLQPFEISAREMSAGAWGVFARQTLIVQVTAADAAFAGSTPQSLAQDIRGRLAWAIQEAQRLRKF